MSIFPIKAVLKLKDLKDDLEHIFDEAVKNALKVKISPGNDTESNWLKVQPIIPKPIAQCLFLTSKCANPSICYIEMIEWHRDFKEKN